MTTEKSYITESGRIYKVLPPTGKYKTAYKVGSYNRQSGKWRKSNSWRFPWFATFDEAQENLDRVAREEGWNEYTKND